MIPVFLTIGAINNRNNAARIGRKRIRDLMGWTQWVIFNNANLQKNTNFDMEEHVETIWKNGNLEWNNGQYVSV